MSYVNFKFTNLCKDKQGLLRTRQTVLSHRDDLNHDTVDNTLQAPRLHPVVSLFFIRSFYLKTQSWEIALTSFQSSRGLLH